MCGIFLLLLMRTSSIAAGQHIFACLHLVLSAHVGGNILHVNTLIFQVALQLQNLLSPGMFLLLSQQCLNIQKQVADAAKGI